MKIVNVHTHIVTQDYIAAVVKAGKDKEDGFPMPTKYSVEDNLKMMDEAGIDMSILSLSTPHPHFGDDAEACDLNRSINEQTKAWVDQYPERFGWCATLPVPDVEGSIKEAIYSLDVLKADGIRLSSNSRGVYLGDPLLDPLFEELNKRKAVIIIHPCRPQVVPGGCFTAGPMPLFEYIADTTRTVINLITSGAMDRYPDIKIVVPHAGSFLPSTLYRLYSISEVLIPAGLMKPVDVMGSAAKFYYDISGDALPHWIPILMNISTLDRAMYGLDYPHTPPNIVVRKTKLLKEALQNSAEYGKYADDMMGGTALRLFGKK
jgi:6-methylsalicylate decarboxylase